MSEYMPGSGRLRLVMVMATVLAAAHPTSPTTAHGQQRRANPTLSDQDIAAAVESELFADASVPHDDIDVGVVAGVVTLTGNVGNLLARDLAQKLAQTVRGVRSVVNRLEVAPRGEASDATIAKEVESALAYDPTTESFEVTVAVVDGVVTLRGTVQSFAERELAEKVARSTSGVRDVRNALVVHYRTDRPDAEIRDDVRARLRWDAYVGDALISASVSGGKVELAGKVASAAERVRAGRLAWVAGVKDVSTEGLTVEPWLAKDHRRKAIPPHVSDPELERAVSSALLYDPRVSAFKVEPHARNGVVTLHGTVDNLQAQQAAMQDARATTGVARVVDRIHVRPAKVPDDDIAQAIRRAFERDPYVERFEVLVRVTDGIASLTGTVDSLWEKARADQLASAARGVRRVQNQLTVYDDRSPLVYEPRVYDYYPYDYAWYTHRPGTWRSDAEIHDEIEDELVWSPFVDADEVKVKVDRGVATLEGAVDSYSEMHSALANAYEGGAIQVRNRLTVQ